MNSKLQFLLGAMLASAAVIAAGAQTASAPSSSPRAPARSENGEVVTLEEFSVSTTASP